jgi:hypothetical protein
MSSVNKTFDVYGVSAADLESARSLVEDAIGIELEPRESSYRGGDYFGLGGPGGENFILQANHDAVEDEWAESQHRDVPFVLYVSESRRADQLRAALDATAGIRLLRREVV